MEEKIGQIATWLADKKGRDIKALDLRGLSPLTESMVFVTARSARHAQSLADELMVRLGERKWEYFGVEGMQSGQWILVDCNDVIVHIFQEESRSLFNVEGLYAKAPAVALPEAVTAGAAE
jgi:ribosome-associated protein